MPISPRFVWCCVVRDVMQCVSCDTVLRVIREMTNIFICHRMNVFACGMKHCGVFASCRCRRCRRYLEMCMVWCSVWCDAVCVMWYSITIHFWWRTYSFVTECTFQYVVCYNVWCNVVCLERVSRDQVSFWKEPLLRRALLCKSPTEWRRVIRCLIFIGHFLQKEPF